MALISLNVLQAFYTSTCDSCIQARSELAAQRRQSKLAGRVAIARPCLV